MLPCLCLLQRSLVQNQFPACLGGILGPGEGGCQHLNPSALTLPTPAWLCACPHSHPGASGPQGGSRAEQRHVGGSVPAPPCSTGWVGAPPTPKAGVCLIAAGAEGKGLVCPKSHPGAPRRPKTGQPHTPGVCQPQTHHPKIVPWLHFPVQPTLWRALLGVAAFPKADPIINYY